MIYEPENGRFRYRKMNCPESVAHAVQLFRRECFEMLGGYMAMPYGGPDWHAEVQARRNGWTVESFPHLKAFHHRPTGTAGRLLRYWFRQGLMDFSMGCDPVFEIARMIRRIPAKPRILGAGARLAGFLSAYCRGEARSVSNEFIRFLRREQKAKLRQAFLGQFRRT
jgi:hypothetical protein